MKNIKILLITLLSAIVYIIKAEENPQKLAVELFDGKSYTFSLNETPKIDFTENTMKVLSISFGCEFEFENVSKVYYTDNSFTHSTNKNNTLISVYPNPTEDYITISGTDTDVIIKDLNGNIILKRKSNEKINIKNLHKGVYLIEINELNTKLIKK